MKSRRALDPIFLVYEHWRPDTNQCFYVGKGYGNRPGAMSRRNTHHMNVQAKLARLGLSVDVRIVDSGLTEPTAIELEKDTIRYWRSCGVKLVNLTDGGEGMAGVKISDETRAKMCAAARARPPRTAEQNRNHSEKMKGKKQSPEVVRKRTEKIRGKKRSDEFRAHISAVRMGMKFSDAHRENLRLSHLGKKPPPKSPEAIERLRENGRRSHAIMKAKRLAEIDEMRQYAGKPPEALYPS